MQDVNQIFVKKTKMNEVRALLGNPLAEIDVATRGYKRMHFGDETTATIWRYLYAAGSVLGANSKFIQIEFDDEGKVADYSFTSSFAKDKMLVPKDNERDFDIFLARKKIIPQKTTQAQVSGLLGKSTKEVMINKPGTKIRWVYDYTKEIDHKGDMVTPNLLGNKEIFGKNLSIDFNAEGIVTDIRGESDFPEDKDKFFVK